MTGSPESGSPQPVSSVDDKHRVDRNVDFLMDRFSGGTAIPLKCKRTPSPVNIGQTGVTPSPE
jgi:hypothetical protein